MCLGCKIGDATPTPQYEMTLNCTTDQQPQGFHVYGSAVDQIFGCEAEVFVR